MEKEHLEILSVLKWFIQANLLARKKWMELEEESINPVKFILDFGKMEKNKVLGS